METELTECKVNVLDKLERSGLAAQSSPELIRTIAAKLFKNPDMGLTQINDELKYTKWAEFQLDEATYESIVNCLRYEGMKGLEYRLGLGFFKLAN
jgi:hypothetical protein